MAGTDKKDIIFADNLIISDLQKTVFWRQIHGLSAAETRHIVTQNGVFCKSDDFRRLLFCHFKECVFINNWYSQFLRLL